MIRAPGIVSGVVPIGEVHTTAEENIGEPPGTMRLKDTVSSGGVVRLVGAIAAGAMVVAVGVMLVFAGRIGDFVNRHPSMKILALSFLLLIGVMLLAEGMGQHIGKGYIYFAMVFSLGVELINMRMRKKHAPVTLHHRFEAADPADARVEHALGKSTVR